MAEKIIMLACSAGMSTSLLVSKMQAAAKADGVDYKIFATSSADIDHQLASDEKPDVLLLGPQIRYMANDVKKKTDKVGIPMDIINMSDYGMMNGENVLKTAEKMLGDA
ncbi:cellobiose PTS, EIIB [Lactobacillus plantarum JDM1] [Lactiplantibacillus mudanjiangensis]|uniref:PTS sugar transporter subunit IIB n=1 Tax=Lactiplantibacillus mudanjiangensis TaxID=1296538 RepID=UPI0010154B97|nr:PTS sugar transporter subunit IIB [Lactiplantibacillus mudanjiangensis]VDG21226.1 cellobiose PTS, EIIB [Lactobacillus plantarum JDM1] [Lactiplantibacillus mudanjiangensis]VDG31836.1 cellobiose PTS, EIIB [Lactobacillus plantarum JDM1] [Lactiplantibacillus mudanjiangensis]